MAAEQKPQDPAAQYLELCQELIDRVAVARNFGLTKKDIWLAESELEKIGQNLSDLRELLALMKPTD